MVFAPVSFVGPSPKESPQGSHARPPTWNHSLSWLSGMLLVLPSLQSPAFTSTIKPCIPDPPMPRTWGHCTQDLTVALNLTDNIAKGYLLVSDPLAALPEGRCCVSVVSVSPGPRLALAHQEVFCEGSPNSVRKTWQRMVSVVPSQGRKNVGWYVCFIWPACCLKKFWTSISEKGKLYIENLDF